MKKRRFLSYLLAGCLMIASPMTLLAQDDFSVEYDDFNADPVHEEAVITDNYENAADVSVSETMIPEEASVEAPEILYEEEIVDALEEAKREDIPAVDVLEETEQEVIPISDAENDFDDLEVLEVPDPDDGSEGEYQTEVRKMTFSGSDNDALFSEYANEILYSDVYPYADRAGVKRNSAKSLKGVNLIVYNTCRQYIVDVAAGKRVSTVFKIPIKNLKLSKYKWTAKELGLNSVVRGKYVSDAAVDAFYQKIGLDLGTIMGALLADCPYELYWFDKEEGISWQTPLTALPDSSGKYTTLSLNQNGYLEVDFSVSIAYASGNFKVNKSTGSSVQTAVNNAKEIVRICADLTDLEKLEAYKDTICALVEYNDYYDYYSKVNGYGDPWQLIWVFDDDPYNNVVCEGYAKAFQYLCDLTKFNSNVCCYSVTGLLDDDPNAGHMWNIVKMYGGKNYLVDITNCDQDPDGLLDELFFLVGTPYVNTAGNRYSFVNSDMEEYASYTYDSDMLALYGKSELALAKANFHSELTVNCAETGDHKSVVVDKAVEATCLKTGLTEGSHCEDCGTVLKAQKTIAKLKPTYKVTAKSIPLKVGQSTSKIKITGLAKGDSIKSWKSNKPKIASVTSKGVIKGVSAGNAVVTVTLASGTKINVTVKVQKTAVAATSIKGLSKTLELRAGQGYTLKPSLLPLTCVQKISYKSSNTKVLTVTSKGVLKAKKAGKANITVTAGKKKFVVKVTVKAK